LCTGTPALTTRGLQQHDFRYVAELVDRGIQIASHVQKVSGPKIIDFKRVLLEQNHDELVRLKKDVIAFATQFPSVTPDSTI